MLHPHPFDSYSSFTDLAALKAISAKPLRKSVRVNTLKCSVERFQEWAKEKCWQLEPVPWCREGFFVDQPSLSCGELRPARRPISALGKDLLHLIGGFYIQEAASMLPVELLDPQPGDAVLDMSAAPGSKTTQIAARILPPPPNPLPPGGERGERTHCSPLPRTGEGIGVGAHGVLVANDIQEHRLWTLKSSLHRSGVTDVIVTKKVGQWFARHMTERFDRVLCDAPCTAQGTVRKDSDALNYCGRENIEKMARLQVQLLEAAIHAAKVGGRIVYATCTLTLEENEGVVGAILERFSGKVEAVDVREVRIKNQELGIILEKAIADSYTVQKFLLPHSYFLIPSFRLWPQTYDTEGFFCAVFQKVASTRSVEQMEWIEFQEERLSVSQQKEIAAKLEDCYGISFLANVEALLRSGEQLFLTSEEVAEFPLPVQDYSVGIPFAKMLNDGRVRVSHEIATLRGTGAVRARCSIGDQQLAFLLEGKDAPGNPKLHGDILLLYKDVCIGRALAKNGVLKNNLPRWMVRD